MTHINQRRDSAANWTFYNPLLQEGEIGWEEDTRRSKLGDGVNHWNDLLYTVSDPSVTKAEIGLGNVDNTSDADKPVSTAQQAALDLKANTSDVSAALAAKASLASPALTGNPTAPTPVSTDSDTSIATTAFVQAVAAAVAELTSPVGSIKEWPGFDAPSNHAMCNGAAYSRATYATVWSRITKTFTNSSSTASGQKVIAMADTSKAVVGMVVDGPGCGAGNKIVSIVANTSITLTTNITVTSAAGTTFRLAPWGNGDGSTTFNVPDRRGVAGVGVDGTAEFAGLNTRYGEKTHILTTPEMPSHQHGNTTGLHLSSAEASGYGLTASSAFQNRVVIGGAPDNLLSTSVGGGGAHNNIQPSVGMNYIIRMA